MSILTRYTIHPDWRDQIARMTPCGDMDALDRLIAEGRVIGEDGKAHPALVEWVKGASGPLG